MCARSLASIPAVISVAAQLAAQLAAQPAAQTKTKKRRRRKKGAMDSHDRPEVRLKWEKRNGNISEKI
jgi:hypothetical protein